MPEKRKPFRQVISALLGAVIGIAVACGAANAAEWPLVIPTKPFANLPEGQGMSFFIDTWEQPSRFAGGGAMTVTATTFQFRESEPEATQYKVLHTAPNYILMVAKYPLSTGGYWTYFKIFTALSAGNLASKYRELRLHSCADFDFRRAEPFNWPVKKLLNAFKQSRCLAKIRFDGSVNIGWNANRLQRRGAWD